MKKLLIATGVGTILLFALDYIWYGLIMGGSSGECCMREQPDFLWLIISYIVFSLAFAGIYDRTASKTEAPMRGLNFGIWMGLLVSVSMTIMWYSLSTNMDMAGSIKEMVYGMVKYVILGVAVSYLIGKTTGDGECPDDRDRGTGKATGGGERGKATGGGERGKATGSGE